MAMPRSFRALAIAVLDVIPSRSSARIVPAMLAQKRLPAPEGSPDLAGELPS